MLTRRQALTVAAGAATAAALPARLAAEPEPAPVITLPLRRSLHEMDLDDPVLTAWREFVTEMRSPARNGQPMSWIGLADIHGTAQGFNLCPHGNWYFLPWHRAYMEMYESAVRDVTGMEEFALPFWDWTGHPDFPAAFGDEAFDGAPNPLFIAGRRMVTGDLIDTTIAGPDILERILAAPSFVEFGSSAPSGQDSTDPVWVRRFGTKAELEFAPHDLTHCRIRGPFMCAATSPQDPIFQMHHCNIDRIWDAWSRGGGQPSANPLWLGMTFADNFIAPDGSRYSRRVDELLAPQALGYTYVPVPAEPEPAPPQDPGRDLLLAALMSPPAAGGLESGFLSASMSAGAGAVTAEPGTPASVSIATAGLNLAPLSQGAAGLLESAGLPPRRAKLFLRDVMPELPEETVLRVFVNEPGASLETPAEGNPNYVTTIGFFGVGPHGRMTMADGEDMAAAPSVAIDLPADAGLESGTVTVQLVAVPQTEGDAAGAVTVMEVEVAVV